MTAKRHSSRLPSTFGVLNVLPVVPVLAVLAVLGTVTGCSHPARVQATTTTRPRPGTPSNPVAPSIYSVGSDRFVESVEVGGKVLVVTPAPKDAVPTLTAAQARSMFDAYEAFNGIYKFDLLGLGEATLEQTPSQTSSQTSSQTASYSIPAASRKPSTTTTTSKVAPTTTTTAPRPTTTTAPPPPTTTTTAPPPTTTTAPAPPTTNTTAAPSTSTTIPQTTTTAPPPPPLYEQTLAWVGIAVGQNLSCAGGSPSTVAIVINADTGQNVVAVAAGGCDPPPSPIVTVHPVELESVPWSLVGPASTAIVVQVPGCGSYVGWTELSIGSVTATQVEAAVPYNPQCANLAPTTKIVNLVVPLGSGPSTVPHAPVGPVDNLEVL